MHHVDRYRKCANGQRLWMNLVLLFYFPLSRLFCFGWFSCVLSCDKICITTAFCNQYLLDRYVDHRQHSHILICLLTAMSIWKRDAVCDGSSPFQSTMTLLLFISLFFVRVRDEHKQNLSVRSVLFNHRTSLK